MNIIRYLFESFTPHGHCYAWTPDILWMNAIGDFGTFVAYTLISTALIKVYNKYKNIFKPFRVLLLLFAAFIFACGITHLIDGLTIWFPTLYRIQGYERLLTAAVSLLTAVLLWSSRTRSLKMNVYTIKKDRKTSVQITEVELPRVTIHHN